MERWMMRGPFEVYAKKQAQQRRREANSRESRQKRARQQLEDLFREVGPDGEASDRRHSQRD